MGNNVIAGGKVVKQAQETCLLPPQDSFFLHEISVAASFAASSSEHHLKAF